MQIDSLALTQSWEFASTTWTCHMLNAKVFSCKTLPSDIILSAQIECVRFKELQLVLFSLLEVCIVHIALSTLFSAFKPSGPTALPVICRYHALTSAESEQDDPIEEDQDHQEHGDLQAGARRITDQHSRQQRRQQVQWASP